MRRWRHDRRRIDRGALAALLAPAAQLTDHIGIDLARQARNFVLAVSVRAMTGGAGRHVRFGKAFLVNPLAQRHRTARRAAEWRRVEMMEMVGERRHHRRAQYMRDIEHDRVGAPSLDEGLQLSLDIFGLLSRKARHGKISEVALAREAVTGLAIFKLGFQAAGRPRHLLLRAS